MGTCCVSGCEAIKMDEENKKFELGGKTFCEGDMISLDGSTGNVYDTAIPLVPASTDSGYFGRIMELADKYRTMEVRANADTPKDALRAFSFGAQGIGLCRTEHMFFEPDRIGPFREMICSETREEREAALAKIEPMQQADFEGLFEALQGYPVTIRFLDPPLHEFVPTEEEHIEELARIKGKSVEYIKQIITGLREFNPMMGHRGCRLTVTYPEIGVMQTKAVIKAALAVQAKHPDWNIVPEIMIPLTGEVKEFKFVMDTVGVGKLMEMGVKAGKGANPNLHCGICGEHGGDLYSVEFCQKIGLDYVSCSPYRVPIARLAAAQAKIKSTK